MGLLVDQCLTLRPCGLKFARLFRPWDSPDKNTGVGCHFLLQGIFPTQGSNPGLLHQQAGMKQINAFIKGAPESSLAPLPHKDMVRRRPSRKEAQTHREPNPPVPCPWTSGLQKCEKEMFGASALQCAALSLHKS